MNYSISDFKMPRYNEIPNVGLYLDQTTKYINDALAPLEVSITPSMLSNYVKHGYITRPIKKQYYADQIAYLLFIALAKQVLSMDNISSLFQLQLQTYSLQDAYTFFCTELEAMLTCIFESPNDPPLMNADDPFAKNTLRSVVIAISHIIFLRRCFQKLSQETEAE